MVWHSLLNALYISRIAVLHTGCAPVLSADLGKDDIKIVGISCWISELVAKYIYLPF